MLFINLSIIAGFMFNTHDKNQSFTSSSKYG